MKIKTEKEELFMEKLKEIKQVVDVNSAMKHWFWQQEFHDAICLQYGLRIPNTPTILCFWLEEFR